MPKSKIDKRIKNARLKLRKAEHIGKPEAELLKLKATLQYALIDKDMNKARLGGAQ